MITSAMEYVEAIEHLPAGGVLIFYEASWNDYEQLLAQLGEGYAVRVSYDEGRLEIVSPSPKHEKYKDLLLHLARCVANETGGDMESLGSTTFKRERRAQGAEPDACFYVQHAAAVIGKDTIDLDVDPPPDVVVEIDIAHRSTGKFSIYAGLGVPEIWRYDGRKAQIYRLQEQGYVETATSDAFPVLTGEVLSQFIEKGKTVGQSAALQWLREWLRTRRPGK